MNDTVTKKPWYKRWWAITFFILLGVGILGNILGPPVTHSNGAPGTPSTADQQPPASPPSSPTFHLGDSVQAGDFSWSITNVSTADSVGSDITVRQADGIFVILDVQVTNTGTTAQTFSNSMVTIIDGQGRQFSADSNDAIWIQPSGSALLTEQVNPGIVKKGQIIFDVPKGLSVVTARIASGLTGSTTYDVQLTT